MDAPALSEAQVQRGRPKAAQETVVVSVRVPSQVYETLSRTAKEHGKTVSQLVRSRLLR